jgi:hypothetical protein
MSAEWPDVQVSGFGGAADNRGVQGGGDRMSCRGLDPELMLRIENGEYVVDSRAVATAILRSGVLVAAQTGDRAAGSEENQSATG